MALALRLLMPAPTPPLSRLCALPAALVAILAAGCSRADADQALVARTERALAELERLKPRMAKAGTPGAETLAEQLGNVRTDLAALPAAREAAAPEPSTEPAPPPPTAQVRCPDGGCWRLGAQVEAGMWRLRLKGGGDEIDDTGPPALGVAIGLERATPYDHRLEWSWGVEAVGTRQQRSDGQGVTLVGLRPFVRAAMAVHDAVAVTVRPIAEAGRVDVHLGAEPNAVLDQADLYAALGVRAGLRVRLAIGGDLTVEAGWREMWFNGSAGDVSYRATVSSPEAAVGWMGRF